MIDKSIKLKSIVHTRNEKSKSFWGEKQAWSPSSELRQECHDFSHMFAVKKLLSAAVICG